MKFTTAIPDRHFPAVPTGARTIASDTFGNTVAVMTGHRLGNEPEGYRRADGRAPRRLWHS